VIQSSEKRIGIVTSSTRSPRLGRPVALGYVHRDFATPGTAVVVDDCGTHLRGEVRSLPFE
jgi:aminomethyltransferase